MYDDVEPLAEILTDAIRNYFTDDKTNIVELDPADNAYAVCMVLGDIHSLYPSVPTTTLTELMAEIISRYREQFREYYEENPLERPDVFKGTPQ
ncbi:hypothetical protein AB1A64_14490 [Ruegeria sp. ANG10]|uniref:hypothetical protein n=1 Tax=Ruegeria sp. ANG10 TaxID=3042467 RepID=UPI0034565AFF